MHRITSRQRRHLCSFASQDFGPSASRFARQARNLRFFDKVSVYRPRHLPRAFRENHAGRLRPFTKGFGYWVWKPEIVKQSLAGMSDGDILMYCDIGCHFNPGGIQRLEEYFEICSASSSGILAFQNLTAGPPLTSGPPEPQRTQQRYTKRDLFIYLGVDRADITAAGQIVSGTFLLRKSDRTTALVEEWSAILNNHPSLVDDSPSNAANYPDFIAHRHDQSVFSLLCMKHGAETLSNWEIELPHSTLELAREQLPESPVWSVRDLRRGFLHRKLFKLRRQLRKTRRNRP